MNNQTVIGIFDTKAQADNAKAALKDSGFTNSQLDCSTYGENGRIGDNYDDVSDRVYNFFYGLFNDKDQSRYYSDVASRGTVVSVHTESMDDAKKAASIMDSYGSIDMNDRYAAYRDGTFDADANAKYLTDSDALGGKIEVVKEDIAIGKREVQTGGVLVRSQIVERPVEETLRLREENVFVKRTPVDRPATEADFQSDTISVTETAEEAVVSKTARVVEEITVGKEVDTRTETIHETVRETEVEVVDKDGEEVRTHNERLS